MNAHNDTEQSIPCMLATSWTNQKLEELQTLLTRKDDAMRWQATAPLLKSRFVGVG